MRAKIRALWRFRPRVLTLIVFLTATAVIALSNLSYDYTSGADPGVQYQSYGWPLIWHRIVRKDAMDLRVIGWYYSLARLAANVVLWLLLLSTLAAGCEWLLRRYRPRPRWRLRTLMAFVAVAAIFCGWYAGA
jgi:hypothetical protein